jgi:hypothetical protein
VGFHEIAGLGMLEPAIHLAEFAPYADIFID